MEYQKVKVQCIVFSLNQTHFFSQDTGCFTINISLIGQKDLTSYFMWVDHMMCHLPPRISRAVEVGWDQNTSSYEDCDTEGSKIETLNLPMWHSGTGVRVNWKFWWEFELSYVTQYVRYVFLFQGMHLWFCCIPSALVIWSGNVYIPWTNPCVGGITLFNKRQWVCAR